MNRKEIEAGIDEGIVAGFIEVVGVEDGGERIMRLTKLGHARARRILIDEGADPDDEEQVEGVIRSWA